MLVTVLGIFNRRLGWVCLLSMIFIITQTESKEIPIPSNPIIPPEVFRDSLPNGLKIIFARANDLPLVELNLVLSAGFDHEPAHKPGLAALTSKSLFGATQQRTAEEITAYLNQLGSTVTAYATANYAQIYSRCLAKNFRQTVDMLSEISMSSLFPQHYFEEQLSSFRKGLTTRSLSASEQTSRFILSELFGETNPIVQNISLDADALSRLTKEDVEEFYSRYYQPNNATLIVVGSLDFASVKLIIQDRFGAWERKPIVDPIPYAVQIPEQSRCTILEKDDQPVAIVRYGMRGFSRSSDDFHTGLVINELLGANRFSRLAQIHFHTTLGFVGDDGYLIISGSSPHKLVGQIIALVDTILMDFLQTPVSDEELNFAKKILTRDFEYSFMTNRDLEEKLQEIVSSGVDAHSVGVWKRRIMDVTSADIQRVSKKIFQVRSRILVITGNTADIQEGLNQYWKSRLRILPDEMRKQNHSSD